MLICKHKSKHCKLVYCYCSESQFYEFAFINQLITGNCKQPLYLSKDSSSYFNNDEIKTSYDLTLIQFCKEIEQWKGKEKTIENTNNDITKLMTKNFNFIHNNNKINKQNKTTNKNTLVDFKNLKKQLFPNDILMTNESKLHEETYSELSISSSIKNIIDNLYITELCSEQEKQLKKIIRRMMQLDLSEELIISEMQIILNTVSSLVKNNYRKKADKNYFLETLQLNMEKQSSENISIDHYGLLKDTILKEEIIELYNFIFRKNKNNPLYFFASIATNILNEETINISQVKEENENFSSNIFLDDEIINKDIDEYNNKFNF
jgi:hypothetical protein